MHRIRARGPASEWRERAARCLRDDAESVSGDPAASASGSVAGRVAGSVAGSYPSYYVSYASRNSMNITCVFSEQ
jgi:hypothetical protein